MHLKVASVPRRAFLNPKPKLFNGSFNGSLSGSFNGFSNGSFCQCSAKNMKLMKSMRRLSIAASQKSTRLQGTRTSKAFKALARRGHLAGATWILQCSYRRNRRPQGDK